MESNKALSNTFEGIVFCFSNLYNIRAYFSGDFIQGLYFDCYNSGQLVFTCRVKEIINALDVDDPDTLNSILQIFLNKYTSHFNDSLSENNKSKLSYNIISNLIEQLHKELNFEGNNACFNEQIFSNEEKKDLMLGLFINYFEQAETSEISKLFYGSNILIKECLLCHSITYNFEIQKIFQFDIDEILSFKNNNNQNTNGNQNINNEQPQQNNIVNLEDCFKYYFSIKNINTKKCKKEGCNHKLGKENKLIYWTSDVMIINLQRKSFEKDDKILMYKNL